ncbi:hypothetical protein D3P96_07300 [Weissella viridescens]|uniref:DUF2922 domain-containing protein n=1 Tax=Weissella viridescens TaxID=1629 RepID=A0A3P2RAP4_WEIVI|nr:hypothetical protein [Weissella viridescens]RRG17573.1 hypothetical protein D3P96_07300 [Weissella viridescens]
MKQLNIHFILDTEHGDKKFTWKLNHADDQLTPETLKEALKALVNCKWLTDAKGHVLWPKVKRVEAAYASTQLSERVLIEL